MSEYEYLSKKLVRRGYDMEEEEYKRGLPTMKDIEEFNKFAERQDLQGWECWFLPENDVYPKVLKHVDPSDVVLDIGAGNFALDYLLVEKCKKVYAIEVNPTIVKDALETVGYNLPRNLTIICGNALDLPIPQDVNTLIILLRHFAHEIPERWQQVPKMISNIGGKFKVTKKVFET